MTYEQDLVEGTPVPTGRRAVCARCARPADACYCHALTTLETRSLVVVLQHPREAGMPFGTARMAQLCLPSAELHVGIAWDGSEVLQRIGRDAERPPVLLHPGPGARDIHRDPPRTPVTLVVLDGTWPQTRAMVRASPALARLPRFTFTPPEPSRYRIRREPRADYVSTIEALAHVLGVLEEDGERFRALLRPLDAMVDAHLAARADRRSPRREISKTRRSPYEALPDVLRRPRDDLVLVFADANAWPRGVPERVHGDELVHWVAHRPGTHDTFSCVLAPRTPLAPDIPRHTELAATTLLDGESVEAFLAAFSSFLRPGDTIASWGYHGLRLLRDCGGRLSGPYVDLHAVARSLGRGRTGSLERYAAAQGLAPMPGHPPGRAGRRLGLCVALCDAWRTRCASG